MNEPKIISLKVSARRSSIVSANTEGRLEAASADDPLGQKLIAPNLKKDIYPNLSMAQPDTHLTRSGRLIYDSDAIYSFAEPYCIASVGKDESAVVLEQWMLRRQSTWLTRYKHIEEVAELASRSSEEKLENLQFMKDALTRFVSAASTKYNEDGIGLDSIRHVSTVADSSIAAIATRHRQVVSTHTGDSAGPIAATHVNESSLMIPATFDRTDVNDPSKMDWVDKTSKDPDILAQRTIVTNRDEYYSPMGESLSRSARALVDLESELLEEKIFSLRLPHLRQIWMNELRDIDLEIRKFQIALLDCFLLPPFSGVVTALYRKPGEYVRRGDPVYAIENSQEVELTGDLVFNGPCRIGQIFEIQCDELFKDSTKITLQAKLVGIRRFDANSSTWSLVFHCDLPDNAAIPTGYEFEAHPNRIKINII